MKEKKYTKEKHLHHMCHEHLNNEVEIITVQGDFNGRLVEIGPDALIIESTRMRQQPLRILIRIETIVAIFPVEVPVRGPFDFGFGGPNFNQPPGSSESAEE